ncbi:MAG: futalosine hydrolase [Bacteroidales bacterium]|nr:futalosine hydrolase [Bacteroidales bacterium]
MKRKKEILIVFATNSEAYPFLKEVRNKNYSVKNDNEFFTDNLNVKILISGIGMSATTYSLTKTISKKKYDLVINAGICGSFNDDICIGDSVSVILDEFGDIGVTDDDNSFKTLFDEGLLKHNTRPFINGKLYSSTQQQVDTELPKVTAITVNASSGNKKQIKHRINKFNPDIETMEGAAVAYVCLKEKADFLQIRTVSNKVEERNKENWNIPLALKNLSQELLNILSKI